MRAADRWLGIPILAMAGLFRRTRRFPSSPQSIGLLKTRAIGDTILLSGVVPDVRRTFPNARLVLFSDSANAAAARLIDGVEHVVLPLGAPRTAAKLLRRHELDVLVDFGPWPRLDALLAAAARSGFTVGFRTAGQHRHYCYDWAVSHSQRLHELDNYRRLVAVLGVRSETEPHVAAAPAVTAFPVPTPYVVCHMFAGGYRAQLREWKEERWAEFARELSARGYAVVLTGSAADSSRAEAFARLLAPFPGTVVDLAGRLDLAEAAEVCRGSSCVVSVNTGLMHLAAATGAPTIGLSGPTSELRWGPVGQRTMSVSSRLPGCGFLNLGGEYRGQREDCMDGIAVQDVVAAFERLVPSPLR